MACRAEKTFSMALGVFKIFLGIFNSSKTHLIFFFQSRFSPQIQKSRQTKNKPRGKTAHQLTAKTPKIDLPMPKIIIGKSAILFYFKSKEQNKLKSPDGFTPYWQHICRLPNA